MEATLKIRAGYDIALNCFQEVPMLLMLSVHPSRQQAKALHSLNRSALMRMTGSDEAGSQSKNGARVYYIAWFCYISLRQLRPL